MAWNGLGENIGYCVSGWAVCERDDLVFDSIPNKVISDVNVFGVGMICHRFCQCDSSLIVREELQWCSEFCASNFTPVHTEPDGFSSNMSLCYVFGLSG